MTVLNDHTIEVKWISTDEDLTEENSQVYQIHLTRLQSSQSSECEDESSDADEKIEETTSNSYIIEDLTPFTNYSLKIKTKYFEFESDFSETIFFTTNEAPPSAPRDINVVLYDWSENDDALVNAKLEWKAPCQFNGVKSKYHIDIIGKRLGYPDDLITEKSEITQILLELKRDYEYEVNIKASNLNFTGDAMTHSFRAPPESKYLLLSS